MPLGSLCRAGSYLITGNDRFFYRTTTDGIDPSCLRPIVKSTRGEHRIALDGEPARWLVSASDPALLGAAGAQAVADGLPELSGVRSRRVWSAVEQEPAPVLCVRTARDRHLAYLNPQGWASGELYRLWPPDGVSPAALAAFLNSAVAGLQLEALGRAYGGGGGPLKVERADLVQLRAAAPWRRLQAASGALDAALQPLLGRPIGTVPEEREQPDRAPLEHLCGELLGLTVLETEAVRDAHAAAVAARVGRAAASGCCVRTRASVPRCTTRRAERCPRASGAAYPDAQRRCPSVHQGRGAWRPLRRVLALSRRMRH